MNDDTFDEKDIIQYNEPYKQTSIWIRGNQEEGYFATIGNHRITPIMQNVGTVENWLETPDWETIIKLVCALVENGFKHFSNTENKSVPSKSEPIVNN